MSGGHRGHGGHFPVVAQFFQAAGFKVKSKIVPAHIEEL